MRTRFLVLAVSLVLAGCGEGSSFDTSFKKSYREKGIKGCVDQARMRSPMGAANVDILGLCTCSIDAMMKGKSATELMGAPNEKEVIGAATSCARRYGAPGAGRSPGSNGKAR
jgi:hypothetical protein